MPDTYYDSDAKQNSVNVLKAALAGTQAGLPEDERDPFIVGFVKGEGS